MPPRVWSTSADTAQTPALLECPRCRIHTVQQQAELANEVHDWLREHVHEVVEMAAATDRLGLAGHSRGVQVISRALHAQSRPLR